MVLPVADMAIKLRLDIVLLYPSSMFHVSEYNNVLDT
jgi:hypothetical protein